MQEKKKGKKFFKNTDNFWVFAPAVCASQAALATYTAAYSNFDICFRNSLGIGLSSFILCSAAYCLFFAEDTSQNDEENKKRNKANFAICHSVFTGVLIFQFFSPITFLCYATLRLERYYFSSKLPLLSGAMFAYSFFDPMFLNINLVISLLPAFMLWTVGAGIAAFCAYQLYNKYYEPRNTVRRKSSINSFNELFTIGRLKKFAIVATVIASLYFGLGWNPYTAVISRFACMPCMPEFFYCIGLILSPITPYLNFDLSHEVLNIGFRTDLFEFLWPTRKLPYDLYNVLVLTLEGLKYTQSYLVKMMDTLYEALPEHEKAKIEVIYKNYKYIIELMMNSLPGGVSKDAKQKT